MTAISPAAIRQAFLGGVRACRGPVPTEEILVDKVARILAAAPTRPLGYAYIAGRHWVARVARDAACQARREAAEAIETARTATERQARAELDTLLDERVAEILDMGHRFAETRLRQLEALRLIYLEGWTCPELQPLWGASRDVVYQYKRRGLLQVEPMASPGLRAYLERYRSATSASKRAA